MDKQRFRNHFSIVFDGIGHLILIIVVFFVTQAQELLADLSHMSIEMLPVLIGIGVFILIMALVTAWAAWVWSKTWIVIEESSISVEKKTFTFNKNTLGIKNISNVNLEQNLFCMLMGTSKVKINTNSLSTANTTDLKIVLKKNEAEQLKQYLITQMELLNGNEEVAIEIKEKDETNYIKSSVKDIVLNSIFSINIIGRVIATAIIASFLVGLVSSFMENFVGVEDIDLLFASIMNAGLIGTGFVVLSVITIIADAIKYYVKMYGFSVGRDKDKIRINYGLFKKVEFSIPVDKVNAIIVHQTFIARLCRRYSVEMINVGMGDDDKENTFVCLYGKKEQIIETMNTILPEFVDAISQKVEKQPKSVWALHALSIAEWIVIWGVVGYVVDFFTEISLAIIVGVIGVIMLLIIMLKVLSYITNGMVITEEYLAIKEGAFATKYSVIKIEKIQFVTIDQDILLTKLGIVRGSVNILAGIGKSKQPLPYFNKDKVEQIRKELLERK